MKKVLIIISIFSLSIAGTGYMAYDFDETENVSIGYNHTFKTYVCEETGKPSWVIAGGVNYDLVTGDGLGGEVGFASVYALPMKVVTDQLSVWATLGFATVTEDEGLGIDGGLTYGLGVHYYLNETVGLGLGMVKNDWEMSMAGYPTVEDTVDRMNLFVTYQF